MSERQLEFAWTREGKILVGYNARYEGGGWVSLGDVTKAVQRLEREREEALALLVDARQRLEMVRRAAGDLDAVLTTGGNNEQ